MKRLISSLQILGLAAGIIWGLSQAQVAAGPIPTHQTAAIYPPVYKLSLAGLTRPFAHNAATSVAGVLLAVPLGLCTLPALRNKKRA